MSTQHLRGENTEPLFRSDAVKAMNYGKEKGTSKIPISSTFKTEGLKPDFQKKINKVQYQKLIDHFSESTKHATPQISVENGIEVEHIRVNVEYGVIHISTFKKGDNEDYEISMFVVDHLVQSEQWFLKILEFNGVMIRFAS